MSTNELLFFAGVLGTLYIVSQTSAEKTPLDRVSEDPGPTDDVRRHRHSEPPHCTSDEKIVGGGCVATQFDQTTGCHMNDEASCFIEMLHLNQEEFNELKH